MDRHVVGTSVGLIADPKFDPLRSTITTMMNAMTTNDDDEEDIPSEDGAATIQDFTTASSNGLAVASSTLRAREMSAAYMAPSLENWIDITNDVATKSSKRSAEEVDMQGDSTNYFLLDDPNVCVMT